MSDTEYSRAAAEVSFSTVMFMSVFAMFGGVWLVYVTIGTSAAIELASELTHVYLVIWILVMFKHLLLYNEIFREPFETVYERYVQ